MTAAAPRRPATDAELALAAALARCSLPVGSSPKRFAREIRAQLDHLGTITEPQAAHLRRLVSTYRRQIRSDALPESERYLLADGAARMAREARDATRWTATPGQSVPSWVVRLTGKATVEAIVAKWGEGATFERPTAAASRKAAKEAARAAEEAKVAEQQRAHKDAERVYIGTDFDRELLPCPLCPNDGVVKGIALCFEPMGKLGKGRARSLDAGHYHRARVPADVIERAERRAAELHAEVQAYGAAARARLGLEGPAPAPAASAGAAPAPQLALFDGGSR
jgi:hypothetical protein